MGDGTEVSKTPVKIAGVEEEQRRGRTVREKAGVSSSFTRQQMLYTYP